jgi:hypothetical protein
VVKDIAVIEGKDMVKKADNACRYRLAGKNAHQPEWKKFIGNCSDGEGMRVTIDYHQVTPYEKNVPALRQFYETVTDSICLATRNRIDSVGILHHCSYPSCGIQQRIWPDVSFFPRSG